MLQFGVTREGNSTRSLAPSTELVDPSQCVEPKSTPQERH